ncbi:MAG: hypothetical protein GF381_04390 [Candidatus Pacebacteria bacterium]|nr:hypothetical protein [Candidatus Paceibacterota bacterium]
MTDRQRAFLCALIYTVKNDRFFNWHRIGVKRVPDGARMYDFHGEIKPDSISIEDDRYNKAYDQRFLENPWGVELKWVGSRRTDDLKIRSSQGATTFYGVGTDYYKFEGWYYRLDTEVKLRDYSQDRREYVYRITW